MIVGYRVGCKARSVRIQSPYLAAEAMYELFYFQLGEITRREIFKHQEGVMDNRKRNRLWVGAIAAALGYVTISDPFWLACEARSFLKSIGEQTVLANEPNPESEPEMRG